MRGVARQLELLDEWVCLDFLSDAEGEEVTTEERERRWEEAAEDAAEAPNMTPPVKTVVLPPS